MNGKIFIGLNALRKIIFAAGVLCAGTVAGRAQENVALRGTVSNADVALQGVNVVLKGTSIGTTTNADGVYSLNVPDAGGAILVFSMMGYASTEIPVNGKTVIDAVMNESSEMIDDVVVVGYNVRKKSGLTGSVASIGADKLANRPASNLSSALAGLAPGVRVTQGSGNPGGERVSILIRGVGSINASAPMVLVDGVPADMTVINPDDVESINFLKDAASAAVYGSRAANGVVLVTTKKGKREKPKISFSAIAAQERAVTSMKFLSDMPLWMELHNTAQRNNTPSASSFWYSQKTIDDWKAANANPDGIYTDPVTGNRIPNRLAYPNTDWANVMFKPAVYSRCNLSVTGGGESSTYMLSASFQENPGALENTGLRRFNIRANVESKIRDFLTVGTRTYAIKEFKQPGNTSMTYLMQAYPGMNPKINGLYGAGEDPNMTNMNNILGSVAANGGQNEFTRINTTWYVNAKLGAGLSAEAKFNYGEYQRQDEHHSKYLPYYRFRTGTDKPVENIGTLDNASAYRYSSFSTSYTADLILRFARTFGEHEIDAFVAYEQYYSQGTGFGATKKGLLDWNVTDIKSADRMEAIGGSAKSALGMISYFGTLNYSFKGRYLFGASLRSDMSSRFAPGHRRGIFPAVSGGWRVSEESFFVPLKNTINELKIKASYGILGNQVSGLYDWQSVYSKVNSVFDERIQNGVLLSKLPNYKMSWEKTATVNLGLEVSMLKRRLSTEIEVFMRNTTDMLVNPRLYLTLGSVGAPKINEAAMKTRGFEISVGWKDRIGKLHYSFDANAGYSENRVISYRGKAVYGKDAATLDVRGNPTWRYTNLSKVSSGGINRILEGHGVNEFYLSKPYSGTGSYKNADGSVDPNGGPRDGMIRSKADLDWARAMIAAGYSFDNKQINPSGGSNLWYGTQLIADVNGDGRYGDSNDHRFTGKSNLPKWTFGLNMSVEWSGFDLGMGWSGRLGSWSYISERGTVGSTLSNNIDALPANARTLFYSYNATAAAANNGVNNYDPAADPNANHTGKYPRLLSSGSGTSSNTMYLFNTSFLKLKSMQFGYSLPKKITNKAGIAALRFFVAGENLITIKSADFPAVDPELGGAVNVYPIARMLSGGFTVTF